MKVHTIQDVLRLVDWMLIIQSESSYLLSLLWAWKMVILVQIMINISLMLRLRMQSVHTSHWIHYPFQSKCEYFFFIIFSWVIVKKTKEYSFCYNMMIYFDNEIHVSYWCVEVHIVRSLHPYLHCSKAVSYSRGIFCSWKFSWLNP